MRRGHFETLRPVCPACRGAERTASPLELASVERERGDIVIEGILHCPDEACRSEFPIFDGIPILLPRAREFLAENLDHVLWRDELPESLESILGDCAGPGSRFDTLRQHLSIYAWDHYGDLDPAEEGGEPRPGATVRGLDRGLGLLDAPPSAPALDLGCSVGRASFELAARTDGLVLGVDVSLSMLRVAQRALREGVVRYPRRRVGIVYERREFPVRLAGAERVDFWACDLLALPFAPGTFQFAAGLAVLDCVSSPVALVREIPGLLAPGGAGLLATPYDWSAAATRIEGWIGGHSQRGPGGGASEPIVRALLTPGAHPQSVTGVEIAGEVESFPWQARLHDRSTAIYRSHLVAFRRTG